MPSESAQSRIPQSTVLIVEDNDDLARLLERGLAREGFQADRVRTTADAGRAVAASRFAALILDRGLPDGDGLTVLSDLRQRGDVTPVLILSARDSVTDRVAGLREGADDYLPKPFAMEELIARLRALLRRSDNLLGRQLVLGNVELDTQTRQVFVAGSQCPLSARELAVLEILLRRCGNVVGRKLFEDQLFGLSSDGSPNAVEVYVYRLRKTLADAGATVSIHTVRGVGYLLMEDKV